MRNDLDAKIKREFLLEFEELLEDVEQSLFTFELNPDEQGIINELFRLIHTLKGSCAMAGFNDLAEAIHLFETLLDKLRKGELAPSSHVIDVSLKFTDLLHDSLWTLKDDIDAQTDTRAPKMWLEKLIGEQADAEFKTSANRANNFFEMFEGNS